MLKKACSAVLTVIAVAWMCFVTYSYFNSHTQQLDVIKQYLTAVQMLGVYVGLYVLIALAQYSYRGREAWNFKLTPLGIWAVFAAIFFAVTTGYLYQSGLWRKTDVFPAEFNVMLWFALVSLTLFLQATFFHVLGEAVLHKYEFHSPLDKFVFAIGAGIMATVAAIFVLGHAHLLYSFTAWLGVIGVLIWRRKAVVMFWREMLTHKIFVKTKVFSPVNFLFLFLTFALAINFLALVRPIPMGNDDTTVYFNIPKLMAYYHHFISNGAGFNYMPLITFSLLLFDNDTLGLFTSFFVGFCGMLAVMALARRFFSLEMGLLGATVLYLTPMIVFQSSKDMKSDPTLFYFITLAIFSMFEWMTYARPTVDAGAQKPETMFARLYEFKWLALAGIFAGFCFGIKFAVMSMIFAMVVLIALLYLGRSGALAVFLVCLLITLKSGQSTLWDGLPVGQVLILAAIILALAVALGLFALVRHRTRVLGFGLSFGVFAGLAVLTFAPWAVTNAITSKSLSVGALLSGQTFKFAPDTTKIDARIQPASAPLSLAKTSAGVL